MSDPQDQAEALDRDKVGDDFPPDKPPGAQAYGAAGAEPHADEPVAARAAREEPDVVDAGQAGDDLDDGAMTQEAEAPVAAEEAALHAVDVAGEATLDATVDDPELAAAHELDPEVDPQRDR